jgi:hypothetical protein
MAPGPQLVTDLDGQAVPSATGVIGVSTSWWHAVMVHAGAYQWLIRRLLRCWD